MTHKAAVKVSAWAGFLADSVGRVCYSDLRVMSSGPILDIEIT